MTLTEKKLTHALNQFDENVETMHLEKLFLVQVRAELTGGLKQLQQRGS